MCKRSMVINLTCITNIENDSKEVESPPHANAMRLSPSCAVVGVTWMITANTLTRPQSALNNSINLHMVSISKETLNLYTIQSNKLYSNDAKTLPWLLNGAFQLMEVSHRLLHSIKWPELLSGQFCWAESVLAQFDCSLNFRSRFGWSNDIWSTWNLKCVGQICTSC